MDPIAYYPGFAMPDSLQPYWPILAFAIGLQIATQIVKYVARAADLRHHPVVERSLPLVPALLGAVWGALLPGYLGLEQLTARPDLPAALGAFYGMGVGFSSGGLYALAREWLPERYAKHLTLPEHDTTGGA